MSSREHIDLRERLKQAMANGSIVLYIRCPILGAHYCLGRLNRLRPPFHIVPLTVLYKQSLGRGRGFKTIVESNLVPTGFHHKARELVKKYIGYAAGLKALQPHSMTCQCRSIMKPVLERIKLRDRRIRYHLSFTCPNCSTTSRPWIQSYINRYFKLVRRALTVEARLKGGLKCRKCGQRSVKAVAPETDDMPPYTLTLDQSRYTLQCSRCRFTMQAPKFVPEGAGLVER